MKTSYNLAHDLEGRTIGDWLVQKKQPHKSSTGGHFSVGYEAVNIHNGRSGFLKALDYTSAFNPGVPTVDVLRSMTNAFVFERDLLHKCKNSRLKYIIRIIDSGNYTLPEEEYPGGGCTYPSVDYMVLEMADCSMRSIIDLDKALNYSWILRSLHNTAVAIEEMHSIQIAHQDIKPSNILLFNNQKISKLGDVGRSSLLGTPAEHDDYDFAGDRSYSPFEQLYGFLDPDWKIRRFSCDMFMFGNLVMVYFNNVSVTQSVLSMLPDKFKPTIWSDTYASILPIIEQVFSECLASFNKNIDTDLRQELVEIVKQLCCPDITRRGDLKRKGIGYQQYSLQRYISKFDLLSRKYEYQLKKVIS